MKPIKTIKDPEAFQLLADETRRKIVFLLRVKEMTVSQVAAELNVTPQAVYHHIKRLLKADMVEVTREERVDHLIESYYRTTAETFNCSVGKTSHGAKAIEEQVPVVLNALKTLGFNIEYDEKVISRLVEIQVGLEKCCSSGEFEDKISELDDVDFLTKQTVLEYAETLSMCDKDFDKQQELKKKFREVLCSLTKG
jgi:DNA-binding transcriptional ArsR family regulator